MKAYTVYQVDFRRHVKEPVGMVLERRREDRGGANMESLLKLAHKLYPLPSPDSHLVLSPE